MVIDENIHCLSVNLKSSMLIGVYFIHIILIYTIKFHENANLVIILNQKND